MKELCDEFSYDYFVSRYHAALWNKTDIVWHYLIPHIVAYNHGISFGYTPPSGGLNFKRV